MSESSLLTLVIFLVLLGGGLVATSVFLVIRKLVDGTYGTVLILIGMVFVLSPIYSVKKIGSQGVEFEVGGVISIFQGADKKPPIDLKLDAKSASSIAQISAADMQILVAYRPNREADSSILIGLLKTAGFNVVPSAEPLEGQRINIQYPPGITRIVYKHKEQQSIVDQIFKVIEYYKNDPSAEIAIGGPYNYIGIPIQILLY
jgi:hypothetical protein